MNGYLLSVIGTVLLSAILTAVIPQGKTAGVIKGISRLVCILVIIAPIPTYLQAEKSTKTANKLQTIFPQAVIEADNDFIKYYCEMRIRETQESLQKEIMETFLVDCKITLEWSCDTMQVHDTYDTEKLQITQIRVTTAVEQKEEVKKSMSEYLSKNYCSEVLIE